MADVEGGTPPRTSKRMIEMINLSELKLRIKKLQTVILLSAACVIVIFVWAKPAASNMLSGAEEFVPAAPQGFGDRQNSWAWSMQWWNGHLYVGTNRAFHCVEVAALAATFPTLITYPPLDADVECTPEPEDLPLQAEIWRWSPDTDTWERVYQSPNDVPIPDAPGKFVARDVGFRGMTVFTEPDGTEALYVTGVSPRFLWSGTTPPRILRSTDGANFEALPQDPGTLLGDLSYSSLRNPFVFRDRFYVNGGSVQGSGALLEAENPAGGNDNFRVVSPSDAIVSAAAPFNDALYLGIRDVTDGYSVITTDIEGTAPYTYTTVVEAGAFLPGRPIVEVLSMVPFRDRLYVGTNGLKLPSIGLMSPAELIRINPDNTWDVVVGNPRRTPNGWMFPVSGFDGGFSNFFNAHMWRMEAYNNQLYLGTFDSSTTYKEDPGNEANLSDSMGFDFFHTANGADYYPITLTGFDDRFNFGVRSLEATPYGLFLGTANYYYGLQIWFSPAVHEIFLPLLEKNGAPLLGMPSTLSPSTEASALLEAGPPDLVSTEVLSGSTVVSWESSTPSAPYHVMRSEVLSTTLTLGPTLSIETTIWTPAEEIGTTTDFYFEDTSAESDKRYVYHVEVIDSTGAVMANSNLSPAPSLASQANLLNLNTALGIMQGRGYLTDEGYLFVRGSLDTIEPLVGASDFAGARQAVADLRQELAQDDGDLIASWVANDFVRFLTLFDRRIQLVEVGVLQQDDLY